jgi:hypothetical protein
MDISCSKLFEGHDEYVINYFLGFMRVVEGMIGKKSTGIGIKCAEYGINKLYYFLVMV